MPHRKQQSLTVVNVTPPMERVAAYVRMSRESQEYSTHNQMTFIGQYAAAHNLSIVKTYADEGISGLRIENRPGLKALLSEVVAGRVDFSKLLVYDVSRWGRFQDIEESAYYEFICRRQGVQVIYCAEPFGTDNSLFSTIGKVLKRGAAAEYSRELSVRMFRGACNIAARGFAVGGIAPFGLSKTLVGRDGKRIHGPILSDRKEQTGCRMNYIPGPAREVRVIREIFRRYVEMGESTREIADYLNSVGWLTPRGKRWQSWRVLDRLREEKYIGTQIYNRMSSRLQARPRPTPRSQWVVKENAFPAIVDADTFRNAQERIARDYRRRTNEELLQMLRRLLAKRGALTQRMIKNDKRMPCPGLFVDRFGSLYKAFLLIGYSGRRENALAKQRFERTEQKHQLMAEITDLAQATGHAITANLTASLLQVDHKLTCAVQLTKYRLKRGVVHWHRSAYSQLGKGAKAAAFHLIACLNRDAKSISHYYLVPGSAYNHIPDEIKLSNNRRSIDQYRLADLGSAVDQLIQKTRAQSNSRGLVLRQLR